MSEELQVVSKYRWGREQKRPQYWDFKRAAIWACPDCKCIGVKYTDQKHSNRYYPMRGKCKQCGYATRNLEATIIQWLDGRKDALEMAKNMNEVRQ